MKKRSVKVTECTAKLARGTSRLLLWKAWTSKQIQELVRGDEDTKGAIGVLGAKGVYLQKKEESSSINNEEEAGEGAKTGVAEDMDRKKKDHVNNITRNYLVKNSDGISINSNRFQLLEQV